MRPFLHPPLASRRSRAVLLTFALVATLAVVTAPAGTAAPRTTDLPEPDTAWFEGAEGFAEGFERAEAEGQSVLLYFYADWCGYCRQLESKILYESAVEDYTKYLVKIRVNPEKGSLERELARRYGVRGYPTVYVHSEPDAGPRSISRMVVASGKRRLATPEEYVKTLSMATGETFVAP